jgi:hypothetical protein
VQPNSVVRNTDSFGVLKLTLHSTSYDWKFVPEAGKTFTDSGTRNCFTPSSATQPTPTNTVAPNLPATQTPLGTSVPVGTPTQSVPTSGLTFKPVADAYVTAAIPNTNYGGSQQLRVDASPIVNGYLRFNVQGVNAPVASAKLRIYANSSSSTGIKVFGVSNNTWVENTITFNNAPPLGSLGGSIGKFSGGTWITIDITPLITGNGVFNVAVTGLNATAISLASREAGANAPQLIITTR